MGAKRFVDGGWSYVDTPTPTPPQPRPPRSTLTEFDRQILEDGTARDIAAWVGDDPLRAQAAWAAESKRPDPRRQIEEKVRKATGAVVADPRA